MRLGENMSVSLKLKEGVEKHDFETIRFALALVLNRSYSDFEDCLKYLREFNISLESLFVEYEGENVSVDVSSATINDLDKVCAGLSRNFSKQRYEAAVALSKKLFPPKMQQASQNSSSSSDDSAKKKSTSQRPESGSSNVPVWIAIGAVALIAIGAVILFKKI